MSVFAGPEIVNNGLVLSLDAANSKSLLSAVEVLVVAAGGGSGGGGSTGYHGGGGGGGGIVVHPSLSITPASSVTVTVGVGGIAGVQTGDAGFRGGNGGNSVFGALTANGGGGGGGNAQAGGAAGGSGGGGNLYAGAGGASNQPSYTGATVFGNAGGAGQATYGSGGGGGGAGSAGGTGASNVGGSGGQGILNSINGTGVYYGGGGAAAGNSVNGTAINGAAAAYTAGAANIGQGAGGRQSVPGLAGGSGIVIVRYPGPQRATGGTITSVDGDTVHTFTSSGTFTLNIISDLRGNGNNGTLTNGPTFNSANKGSLVFDGVDDYVSSTVTGTFSEITFDYWGFFDDPTLSTTSRNESAFGDWTSSRVHWGTRWSVGMHWNVNSVWAPAVPTTNLNYGWNHFSLIWNHNTSQKLIYINNILSYSQVTNGNMVLGDFRIGVATTLNAYYRGNISKFKIYNRALSAAEVQQNFQATRGRFEL